MQVHCAHELLADPEPEQPRAGRRAVHTGRRLLADLRADAHRQPVAWRVLHVRRLHRLHCAGAWLRIRYSGARRRPGSGHPRWHRGARRAAAPRGQHAVAGAGHAGGGLRHGRREPLDLGRRSAAGVCACGPGRRRAIVRPHVPAVPVGRGGVQHRGRHLPVAAAGQDPAGDDDPRQRGRPPDGPRHRRSGHATLHRRVLPGHGAGRHRRRNRRAYPLGVSGAGCGHAAACAGGRHSRRAGQPGGGLRRQLLDRLHLQLRPRAVPRSGLHHPVSPDGGDPGGAAARLVRKDQRVKRALFAAFFILLLCLPLLTGSVYYTNLASQALIAALFALSLNLLVGYAGLTSLGHAGYLGLAAYTSGWLMTHLGWGHLAAAAAALAFSTVMAAIFGLIALRAAGISFLMITLALGQVLWGLAYRWTGVTGGDNGISGLTRPQPFGIGLGDPTHFYYFALLVFLAVWAAVAIWVRSPFGASIRGSKDQPHRMSALGYNVWLIRWITFVASGFL